MKLSVEHIGQSSSRSWLRKVRGWLRDLLGSEYVRQLERDVLHLRVERDRELSRSHQLQERLLEVMAQTKGIPWRPLLGAEKPEGKGAPTIAPTRWQQIQAEAIAENARLEAEDAAKQKSAAQEN